MNAKLRESTVSLGEVTGKRRWYARLIAVGSGSSGFHTAEALRTTGPAAWPAGTKINVDHASWSEYLDQPAGSLKTLAGVITSTPEFRDDLDVPGLYSEIEIGQAWGPFVEEFAEFIGLSITSDYWGDDKTEEGQSIVEGYVPSVLNTVDLVTAPGAKGRLLQAIESFNGVIPTKENAGGRLMSTGKRVREALNSDRRDELSNLVKDAYSGERKYVWVRDFNEETNTVYFDIEDDSGFGIYQQSYSLTNDVATTLDGDSIEVRVRTEYIPMNGSQTTAEETHKEHGMTPEEKAELAAMVATAVAEALVPTKPVDEETGAIDPATVAEALVAADLPESARKRVYEALKIEGADITAAIEHEKQYIADVLKESAVEESPGRLREAVSGKTENYSSPWGN